MSTALKASAAALAGVLVISLCLGWAEGSWAEQAWSIAWRSALVVVAVDLLVLGALELSLRGLNKKEHKQT